MGSKAAKQRWKCWATTCPLLFLTGHQWTNYWDRASIFSHLCLSRIFSKKISNNIISYKSNIRAFVSKRYNKSRFVSRLHLELCPFFACRSLSLTVCSSSPHHCRRLLWCNGVTMAALDPSEIQPLSLLFSVPCVVVFKWLYSQVWHTVQSHKKRNQYNCRGKRLQRDECERVKWQTGFP